jgi:hypothetical protein
MTNQDPYAGFRQMKMQMLPTRSSNCLTLDELQPKNCTLMRRKPRLISRKFLYARAEREKNPTVDCKMRCRSGAGS